MRASRPWPERIGMLLLALLVLCGQAAALTVPYEPLRDAGGHQTVLTLTENGHTITTTQKPTGIGSSDAPATTFQAIPPVAASQTALSQAEAASPSPSQQPTSGLSPAQIGGIVAGAVGSLLVVLAVAWLFTRRQNRLKRVSPGRDVPSRGRTGTPRPMAEMSYKERGARHLPVSEADTRSLDPLMMSSASNSSRDTSVVGGARYHSNSGSQATLTYGLPTTGIEVLGPWQHTILECEEENIGLPPEIHTLPGRPPESMGDPPIPHPPTSIPGSSSTDTGPPPASQPQQQSYTSVPPVREKNEALSRHNSHTRQPQRDVVAKGGGSTDGHYGSAGQAAEQAGADLPDSLDAESLTNASASTATPSELADSEFDRTTLESAGSLSISESSDSSIIPLSLEMSKRRAVDTLMAEFRSLLNHHGCLSGVSVRAGAGSPSDTRSRRGTSSASSSGGLSRSTKRNREDSVDSNSTDETGREGESKRARQGAQGNDMVLRRLACPFFKHNTKKHLKLRSCGGPGWESTHRVKEHLYRNHKLPIHCNRCGSVMSTNVDLVAHQRQAVACEVQLVNLPEGIDDNQEKALRKRLRGASEEEKWLEIYKIIFPDEDGDLIPSPYYDNGNSSPQDAVVQYERVQRRELLRVVRKRLEEEVLGIAGPLEDALRAQFVGIVRDAQIEVFRSYQGNHLSKGKQPLAPNERPRTPEESRTAVAEQPQYPAIPPSTSYSQPAGSAPFLIPNGPIHAEGMDAGLAIEDFDFDPSLFEMALPALEQQQQGGLPFGYPTDLNSLPYPGYMDAPAPSFHD